MNKLLLSIVSVMLVLWLSLGSWWYTNNYGGNSVPSFSVTLDGNEYSAPETFSFYESNPDPIIPVTTQRVFQKLANILADSDSKNLKLYGIHSARESTPQLGKARAESIKQVLVQMGAPEDRIITNGIPLSSGQFINGQLYGGVYFRFEAVNKKPIKPVYDKSGATKILPPTNIYFDNNESLIVMTTELEQYVEEARRVLRELPEAHLAIIGHTDSSGNTQHNLSLSKTRAKNVKKFLIRHGLEPNQLKLEYKGSDSPMRPNQSAADKRKNRRVELRIRE